MKPSPVLSLLILLLAAACTQEEKQIDRQYLLTNEISMRTRGITAGAYSYLVTLEGKTYLCTAKHLLGPGMGFKPSMDLKTVNDSLDYWKAHVRANPSQTPAEIIEAENILCKDNGDDLILFSITREPKRIGVLRPRFDKLQTGSKIRLLGCEYVDTTCIQKVYYGKLKTYLEDEYIVAVLDSTINLAGFAGAPVLDGNKQVIGHLVSEMVIKKQQIIYIAPISWALDIIHP